MSTGIVLNQSEVLFVCAFKAFVSPILYVFLNNSRRIQARPHTLHTVALQVEFGTISDYFKAVAADRSKSKSSNTPPLPTFVGDFFPYNDRDDQYWTGFYSSRPLYKFVARVLQGRLR